MLYIFENTDKLKEDFINRAIPYLSLQRLRKIDDLRMMSDKVNSAAVFLMLRYALKKEYGIDEAPEFIFKKNEKPYISGRDDIFFNLSHSRNSCACIISDTETAVDISDLREISERTAKFFCAPEEYERAASSVNRCSELVRLWTIKECYSKYDGRGLRMNYLLIGDKEKENIHTIYGERYVAAYYAEKETETIYVDAGTLLGE